MAMLFLRVLSLFLQHGDPPRRAGNAPWLEISSPLALAQEKLLQPGARSLSFVGKSRSRLAGCIGKFFAH
jgi:hypothetical protein